MKRARPVDVREGDLIRTQSGTGVCVSSELVEPGGGKVDANNSNRRHEWWITYVVNLGTKITKLSMRFSLPKMTEPLVEIVEKHDVPER